MHDWLSDVRTEIVRDAAPQKLFRISARTVLLFMFVYELECKVTLKMKYELIALLDFSE